MPLTTIDVDTSFKARVRELAAELPDAPFVADDVLGVKVFYRDADNNMRVVVFTAAKDLTEITRD